MRFPTGLTTTNSTSDGVGSSDLADRPDCDDRGFSLVELIVAMAITLIVMGIVFTLLTDGQKTFNRENEVAALQAGTRAALEALNRDLEIAGYKIPPQSAVLWRDGKDGPDEVTVVYAGSDTPILTPNPCRGGFRNPECVSIHRNSEFAVDLYRIEPTPVVADRLFEAGEMLLAMEKDDCNEDNKVGLVAIRLTQPARVMLEGTRESLRIQHDQGREFANSGLELPDGYNYEVMSNCAVVGPFHVVSFRIASPDNQTPALERRDWLRDPGYIAVAPLVEDLQFRYGVGAGAETVEIPRYPPHPRSPETWINQIEVQVSGRSESENLKGATSRFEGDDAYLRKTFSSSMSLRNVTQAIEDANSGLPPWRR